MWYISFAVPISVPYTSLFAYFSMNACTYRGMGEEKSLPFRGMCMHSWKSMQTGLYMAPIWAQQKICTTSLFVFLKRLMNIFTNRIFSIITGLCTGLH